MLEFITFLLAPIAYAGLAIAAVRAVQQRPSPLLQRAVAAVAVAHVALVWSVRYHGQLSEATRNGYPGFLIFHTALVAIVGAAVAAPWMARRLLVGAFAVVTLGALGAVFRYEVVAVYQIPVMLIAVGGGIALVRAHRVETGRGHPERVL